MKSNNPIYRLLFKYHTGMIEICNIKQCLGIISDGKAELTNKKHVMGAIKAAYFGGFATDEVKEIFQEEEL